MPDDSPEVSFELEPSFEEVRGRRWLIVRLEDGADIAWGMLPNPLSLRSAISPRALADLSAREGIPVSSGVRVVLRNPRIAGQRVPDPDVRVSATVLRLRVDGILGLDFFERFTHVSWEPQTGRVTLVDP